MKTKIFTSIFILSLLSACDLPSWPDEIPDLPESWFAEITLRIKGTISDISDNSPIKARVTLLKIGMGAWVGLNSVWSNEEGHYSLIFTHSELYEITITEKDFFLEVSATGYKTKKITYEDENHVRLTDEWQIIDVQLEPESGGLR